MHLYVLPGGKRQIRKDWRRRQRRQQWGQLGTDSHIIFPMLANPKWQNHYMIRIIQHLSKSQHLKLRCAGLGRVRGSPEFDPAAVESSLRSPTLLVYFYEQITFAKVQRVQRIRRGNCCKNDRSFFVLRVSRLDSHRMKIWGQIAEVKNGETSELKTQLKRFWPRITKHWVASMHSWTHLPNAAVL